jgi:hypothetical protein
MVNKLHKSWLGGHVNLLVAVDKFTKWIEEALITMQDLTAVVNFIKSIVFPLGVNNSIITHNGTDITSKKFTDQLHNGLKKMLIAPLERAKHAWVDELPSMLWSLRTTPSAATQETPFFLVHGAEAANNS